MGLDHLVDCIVAGACYEPPLTNVFTMQWFLTIFATCLPKEVVLRVWDAILLEGSEVVLRTALCLWGKLARWVGHGYWMNHSVWDVGYWINVVWHMDFAWCVGDLDECQVGWELGEYCIGCEHLMNFVWNGNWMNLVSNQNWMTVVCCMWTLEECCVGHRHFLDSGRDVGIG